MDEAKTREHVQQLADAVVRGDNAVVVDFSEDRRPQVPQIAQALPQPVTAADVLSLDVGDAESVATIRYLRGQRRGDYPLALAGRWRAPSDRSR
jgi:hypothetical protein